MMDYPSQCKDDLKLICASQPVAGAMKARGRRRAAIRPVDKFNSAQIPNWSVNGFMSYKRVNAIPSNAV